MLSKFIKSTLTALGILAGLIVMTILFVYFATPSVYANRILPGTQLLGLSFGGKTVNQARDIIDRAAGSADFAPLTLTFNDQKWVLSPKDFGFRANDVGLADALYQNGRRGTVYQQFQERARALFGFTQSPIADISLYQYDKAKLATELGTIATAVNQTGRDPKLVIKGNRATTFVSPQDGRELDIAKTSDLIARQLLDPNRQIELPVTVIPPKKSLAATNALGINVLLGHGESNFTGSPKNRIQNLTVGAQRFDGMLVAPGATFSFVQNLGPVDASTGYLPELVIKGDQTTPEFGGGLCQVSTTAFRGLLAAGLPIVERRNHSYQVSYYSPSGTDATIYEPSPDLKFKNDTPGDILIDTYIVGKSLYFDYYGTDTGRKVEMTGPFISNVTALPEAIYVDTSTLAPGVTKQIETAHRGADAVLYRKVYQNGKVVINDTFKSHYIPWPPKYLRGVEAAPAVPVDLNNVVPPTNPPTSPSQTPPAV